MQFEYRQDGDSKKGSKRSLSVSSEQMAFSGANHGETALPKGVCRYAVGVVNRKRSRIELYDAESSGAVFGLLPRRSVEDEVAAVSAQVEGASAKARRDMLIDDFGSRKKQKMEKSKAANIVDVSAVTAASSVAADLRDRASGTASTGADAATGTTTERKVAEGMEASRKAVLPPYNVHATTPDNAYPVDGLLGGEAILEALAPSFKNIMSSLKDTTSLTKEISAFAKGPGAAYLHAHLVAATMSGDASGSEGGGVKKNVIKKKLRCLAMLKYMLDMVNADTRLRFLTPKPKAEASEPTEGASGSKKGSEKKGEGSAVPEEPFIVGMKIVPRTILDYLLAKFTEARSTGEEVTYHRTEPLTLRLLSHIAVLALTIQDFRIADLRPLAAAVKLQPAKLLANFREAGCTYEPIRSSSEAGSSSAGEAEAEEEGEGGGGAGGRPGIVSYSVVLKMPLTFPKAKSGPKRR